MCFVCPPLLCLFNLFSSPPLNEKSFVLFQRPPPTTTYYYCQYLVNNQLCKTLCSSQTLVRSQENPHSQVRITNLVSEYKETTHQFRFRFNQLIKNYHPNQYSFRCSPDFKKARMSSKLTYKGYSDRVFGALLYSRAGQTKQGIKKSDERSLTVSKRC